MLFDYGVFLKLPSVFTLSFISYREMDISSVCSIQSGRDLSYRLVGAVVSMTKSVL